MSLVELLTFLEVLKDLDCEPQSDEFLRHSQGLTNECKNRGFEQACIELQQSWDIMNAAHANWVGNLKQIRHEIWQEINKLDQHNLKHSWDMWDGGERNELSYGILKRRRILDPITQVILGERLKIKTSWQWPALIFRPTKAWHIDSLVSCDPLYMIDTDQDLIDATNDWWNPDYQRRLCKYVFTESATDSMLGQLPISQFGLVYVPYFFDFRPVEMIEKYLAEIQGLVRPGGHVLFTYNNCDTVSGAQLFERHSGSYAPARLLRPMIETMGFEIIYEFSDVSGMSWMELKKPGELTSIRAGQALAAVLSRPQQTKVEPLNSERQVKEPDRGPPLDIDPHDIAMYTEVNILIDICDMLGISKDKTLSKGQPNVKRMRKAITEHLRSERFPAEKLTRLLEKRKPK